MRTEIITKTYALFSELSEERQAQVIDKNRDCNVSDEFWYEYTLDKWHEILETVGVSDIDIRFSGFWSQGDGASFTGYYSYNKGALKKLKSEYPDWLELHGIVAALQDTQRDYFYTIEGEIYRSSHFYYHENTVSFSPSHYSEREVKKSDENHITDLLRSLMQLIYSDLENEYEYLTSDQAIKESLICSEFEVEL